jgi:hypothetical protein
MISTFLMSERLGIGSSPVCIILLDVLAARRVWKSLGIQQARGIRPHCAAPVKPRQATGKAPGVISSVVEWVTASPAPGSGEPALSLPSPSGTESIITSVP